MLANLKALVVILALASLAFRLAAPLCLRFMPAASFAHRRNVWFALTVGVLMILWRLYQQTRDRDNLRTFALALVSGGAVGNALDRLRSADGVVDFLDLGTSAVRWPTRRVRARCRICASSCASLLSSTKRMVGRDAASQIAAASLASFLPSRPCMR